MADETTTPEVLEREETYLVFPRACQTPVNGNLWRCKRGDVVFGFEDDYAHLPEDARPTSYKTEKAALSNAEKLRK